MADEERLREELAQHLEALKAEYERRGMSPEAARRAARLKLGGEEQITESWRGAHRWHWFDDLRRDLALGARSLRRSSGFTLVVVLSLALGIGANAAIFSLLDAALWQKLPVRNPDQLVVLYWRSHTWPKGLNNSGQGSPPAANAQSYSLAYPTFQYLRDHSSAVFQSLFGLAPMGFGAPSLALEVNGRTALAKASLVTGQFFSCLGVSAAQGRVLNRRDAEAGVPETAVLSYAYWTKRFGQDPAVVGKAVSLGGAPATIVGVAAKGFQGVQPGSPMEIWIAMSPTTPAALAPWGYSPRHQSVYRTTAYWWLQIMARLRPGVTPAQAIGALNPAFRRLAIAGLNPAPKGGAVPNLGLWPGGQGINVFRERSSSELWILMSVAGLLLLLACVNVASLLLARATARGQEIAVRLALGASRGRLIRQLLTESVLLACLGGAIGAALAPLGLRALLAMMGGASPLPLRIALNGAIVAFTCGVSILVGILFGLAPALRCTRVPIGAAIKSGRAEVGVRVRLGGDKALAMGQIALSLLLLVAAGLFLRTFTNLGNSPLGFNPDNIILFGLNGSEAGYRGANLTALYARVHRHLLALPGVEDATASRLAILSGWESDGSVSVPGVKLSEGQSQAFFNNVGPDFLKTMGIPLLRGRDISVSDMTSSQKVGVVSVALAHQLFGQSDPIGRVVGHHGGLYTIVGVAADSRYNTHRGTMPAVLYFPYTETPRALGSLYFEVRARNTPQAVEPEIRRAIRGVDPALAIAQMRLQANQDAAELQQPLMFSQISGFFGLLGLLLAAIGIEGTMAYAVARRRGEIGVRMALGAGRAQVLRAVLREAAVVAIVGVVIGIGLAIAASRYIGSQLYQVKPTDPLTFAACAALLFLVALAAGYWPAYCAAQTDPMQALRTE